MAGSRNIYEQAMRAAYDHSWNRNWKAAIEAYKQALSEFPTDPAATLGLGSTFLELGQPQVALKVFERAVQLAPEDPNALVKLADVQERLGRLEAAATTHTRTGNVFARQGKVEEAVDAWTQASRLVPEQLEATRHLAQALEELGREEQAAAEHATLATIAHRQGDKEAALGHCREALRLDAHNSRAQALLESLHEVRQPAYRGAHEERPYDVWEEEDAGPAKASDEEDIFSLESLAEEGETAGQSPLEQAQRRALQELADVLFEVGTEGSPDPATVSVVGQALDRQTRGMLDDAISGFSKALSRLNSALQVATFFNLGALYYQRLRYDEAVEAFRRSMRDERYRLGSHYALGLTYYASGNIDRSLEHFIEVVKAVDLQMARPDQAERMTAIYQQLGDSYIAKGDTEKADVFIQTLLKFFSEPNWEQRTSDARRRMDSVTAGGQLSGMQGQLMTLAEYLETPETEVIITAMALTGEYMHRNMGMTAAEECFRAIQKAPTYLPLHVRLGDIFLQQDHTVEAITKYLVVADVCLVRGDTQQAIDIYHKVLRTAPMDVQVRAKLIDLLIAQGEGDAALEQYLILADVYYQLAQVERAMEKYKEALQLVANSDNEVGWKINILHRMGDIYNQRVDWAQAIRAYESIVALSPDDERAQLSLIDLYYKQGQSNKALQALDSLLHVYQSAGSAQKVLNVLRDAVQARPEEMGLRARLAAAYAHQRMNREAIAEYDALGEMQLEAGLHEEAARTVQTIIGLGPNDVDGYRRLFSQIKGGSV